MLDIVETQEAIKCSFVTGLVISFAFLFFVSKFAECLAWVCIVLGQIGFIGTTVLVWMKYTSEVALYQTNTTGDTPIWKLTSDEANESYKWQWYYLLAGIVITTISFCFLMCTLCQCKQVKMAIDVVDASADFLV